MIFWAYALEYCHKKTRSTEATNYQKMKCLIKALVTVTHTTNFVLRDWLLSKGWPHNQGSSAYLSNDILNQLVHGKCDVSMYTKHLTTCILEVGGVHITWHQSKQKEHMHCIQGLILQSDFHTFSRGNSYCQTQKTVNTWKISGMLIVYWPITIKFRIRKHTPQKQTDHRCCLRVSYLAPYWLISRNTIAFHKYFWCSRFCEFHSKGIW